MGSLAYDRTVNCCQRAGFNANIVQYSPQFPTLFLLVAAGTGVSLAPACMTRLTGRSLNRAEPSIEDYKMSLGPLYAVRNERSGKQLGDPEKAAKVILKLVSTTDHLLICFSEPDAVERARERVGTLLDEIASWENVSPSANYS
jgi:hypothetical protein